MPVKQSLVLGWRLFLVDLRARYHGTLLGVLWLLIHPLFLLAVYTVVFGEVLQLRFGNTGSTAQFAVYLFTGLLVFNAFSEVLIRAPSVLNERRDVLLNTPLPAWLLPIIPVAVSVVLELVALVILGGALLFQEMLSFPALLVYPLLLIIRIIFSLAASYTVAVLGVFLHDLRQLIPALLTVLLFISPILYPLDVIPERFLPFYHWNVLGQLVQSYREILLEDTVNPARLSALLGVALILMGLAVLLFRSLMPRARYVL